MSIDAKTSYIYCFSIPRMPKILKIGIVEQITMVKVHEIKVADDILMPCTIEYIKNIRNPHLKWITLCAILLKHKVNTSSNPALYHMSLEEFKRYLDLMDGYLWIKKYNDDVIAKSDTVKLNSTELHVPAANLNAGRNLREYFTDGQYIRYVRGDRMIIGEYNEQLNVIVSCKNHYATLSDFVRSMCVMVTPEDDKIVYAWCACECEVNGVWMSTYILPKK